MGLRTGDSTEFYSLTDPGWDTSEPIGKAEEADT